MSLSLIIKIISGIVAIGTLITLTFQMHKIEDLKAERDSWKDDYNTASAVAKANESAVLDLREKNQKMQEALVEWKHGYESIDYKLRRIDTNVNKLKTENEDIRTLLATVVPCELWNQLFPTSLECPHTNTDRVDRNPDNPIPTNK